MLTRSKLFCNPKQQSTVLFYIGENTANSAPCFTPHCTLEPVLHLIWEFGTGNSECLHPAVCHGITVYSLEIWQRQTVCDSVVGNAAAAPFIVSPTFQRLNCDPRYQVWAFIAVTHQVHCKLKESIKHIKSGEWDWCLQISGHWPPWHTLQY